jgi:hypothetical protein
VKVHVVLRGFTYRNLPVTRTIRLGSVASDAGDHRASAATFELQP